MKRTIFLLTVALSGVSFAKVEAGLEDLRDTQFQCDVVSVTQTRDGEVEGSMKEGHVVMKTYNQDGGDLYTDAKCFTTPMIGKKGEETSMAFGCLPLDTKHVKTFETDKLQIERKEYKEVLKIDFTTGMGSRSFRAKMCGWGWDCTILTGEAVYENCVFLGK